MYQAFLQDLKITKDVLKNMSILRRLELLRPDSELSELRLHFDYLDELYAMEWSLRPPGQGTGRPASLCLDWQLGPRGMPPGLRGRLPGLRSRPSGLLLPPNATSFDLHAKKHTIQRCTQAQDETRGWKASTLAHHEDW